MPFDGEQIARTSTGALECLVSLVEVGRALQRLALLAFPSVGETIGVT